MERVRPTIYIIYNEKGLSKDTWSLANAPMIPLNVITAFLAVFCVFKIL